MRQFHERGTPIMRPLFYHYPEDAEAWNIADGYLFGQDVLVAPILEAGAVRRRVYLPRGSRWLECATGLWHEGGQWVESPAPLDTIPCSAATAFSCRGYLASAEKIPAQRH